MKRTQLLGSLLLLGIAACGNGGSGASGAPVSGSGAPVGSGAPAGSGVATAADDNAPEEPGMTVLEPGAAPRTKLRYHPADGAVETMLLVQTRSEAFVGDKPRSVPSSKLTLAFTVKGKSPSGDRDGTYEIKDAIVEQDGTVAPALAREMQAFLKKVVGFGGTFAVSERGAVRKVDPAAKDTDAISKQFAQNLADSVGVSVIPLPSAAVGVGAKWQHVREARQAGIIVKMRTTYKLVSIQGDEVKLEVTDAQTADKSTMDAGVGKPVTVSNYKNDGTGEITLSLQRLTPKAMSMKSQGSMTMDGLPIGKKDVRLNTSATITGS